jgi:hypothetical protein
MDFFFLQIMRENVFHSRELQEWKLWGFRNGFRKSAGEKIKNKDHLEVFGTTESIRRIMQKL